MPIAELQSLFRTLSDEELSGRSASGDLTEEAQAQADTELATRGLPIPPRQAPEPAPETMAYQGDLTVVAKNLTPTEAHMLCACLQAGGVPGTPRIPERKSCPVRVRAGFRSCTAPCIAHGAWARVLHTAGWDGTWTSPAAAHGEESERR